MGDGSLQKVALLVGLILIVIPDPATTTTGLLVTAGSVGMEGAAAVEGA
ncbi:hypothetical protein JZX76_11490 [Haloarcula hispanica]|nr:hypothetical protein [Haloarcula hispanica]MCJ0620110.1 hypothetical protein [Haloarcula hispanica]